MTPALVLRDLHKTFPAGRRLLGPPRAYVHALRGVSLEVAEGAALGLVGESGCGKSTLARILVGLAAPTRGTVEVAGRPLPPNPREAGRAIQYIFQDPIASLNPRHTLRDAIVAPLRHLLGLSRRARARRLDEVVEAVGLGPELLDRYPHEVSGGQAQRVGIARALAAEARVLVLDEPVSALDVSVQAQVLNLLARLRRERGLTYLLISHDLAVVETVSDWIAVLYFGRVVEIGPAAEVLARPRHPYTRLLAESAPAVGRPLRVGGEGELPDPLRPPAGCAFRARCPRALPACAIVDPALGPMGPGHAAACLNPEPA